MKLVHNDKKIVGPYPVLYFKIQTHCYLGHCTDVDILSLSYHIEITCIMNFNIE